MLSLLRHIISLRSPLRVIYHWCRGVIAYTLSCNPAKGMYIIGVTGTKGKTTTCTLIAQALETSGEKVGLITTAQVWMPGERRENHSKMTMNSPFGLWKLIREARSKGVTHLIVETSSHGIYYYRNFGLHYDIVALTNISQDHLDLHGTMEHYVKTKARLFRSREGKICVLPRENVYFDIFFDACDHHAVTYGTCEGVDFQLQSSSHVTGDTQITIREKDGTNFDIITPLSGQFNAENILTATSVLRSMKVRTEILQSAWHDFAGAPGRMESVPNNRDITVLVDYAHTEESLRSVLNTLKVGVNNEGLGTQKPRIILVFGATGDRDTTKRPKMGQVAHELADIITLTDDDTYTESSDRIIEMVKRGIPRDIGDTFQVIPDREVAILWALTQAQKGDIVLIAGKGCETVQITNKGPIPWSDRGIVEEFWGELSMQQKTPRKI